MSIGCSVAAPLTAAPRRFPIDALVPVVVALGVLRVPGVDWLYPALGVVLLARASRLPHVCRKLAVVFATCLGAALIATWADPSGQAFTSSYLWPAAAQSLFAFGVMAGTDPTRQIRRLIGGLFTGFVVLWAIGVGEIASGLKLIRFLSPDSSMAQMAAASRWVTMAVFTNYNDYCLALAMLAVLLFAHVLFVPRAHPFLVIARWLVLGTSAALVTIMGSRGSLLAGLLGAAVVAVIAIRAVRPRFATPRRIGMAVAISLPLALWLWSSPYVQDHSTATREAILSNSFALWTSDPWTAVFGYGSAGNYELVTERAYPGLLMDPHNLLLEVALNFGVIALGAGLWWWVDVLQRTVTGAIRARTWAEAGTLALVVSLPVMGVVSSRLLPYIYVPVLATAASLMRLNFGPSPTSASARTASEPA